MTALAGARAADESRQSFLASMGPMFRRLLEMHGRDAVGIARDAGIDLATIPAPGERIEVDKIDAILRVAIPLIRDPAFGLQAARCWHPSELGVLGYAWLSSSTLRTGLERAVRYSRLVGERGITEIEDTRLGLKVRFRAKRGDPALVPVAAVFVDIVMALLLDLCRMNAGAALRPLAATLRRRKPDPADAYERFFGCPVQFGADENAFVLSARDADRPLPSANRQLAVVFDRMLTEELARLEKSDVVSRTRAAVLEHLSSGEGTAQDMAKQLHMSPRTLQRKLAEAKTTYLQLVDDTRKDLALRYIEDPRRSVTDITFSLGFSQPSAFTRAFKRWTGLSPSDYRTKRLIGR
ncbi:MAG TPA: AraC family transcriptional regulator [Burkholderiales bacterium]|nr:AraC family transcriptional regulator [Burkholderiales bacterium]